jgi:shikimate dehydrogenase
MKTYGLVGFPLGHSFSKKYFTEKFENENLNDSIYLNFELENITDFPKIFEKHDDIFGLNCTIPYKQQVIQYLDLIDEEARVVGAINTIKIIRQEGKVLLKGYNTDIIGFEFSLKPMLNEKHNKALILGTGGASRAIKHTLDKLGIQYVSASIEDELNEKEIRYDQITDELINEYLLIINATPLGTYPKVDACAPIPYDLITPNHVLFDLVYNPEITLFMQKGLDKGAKVKNGLEMLHTQALAAWEIWNREEK